MFPMRTSSIFKSRWLALLWAAGILWFAYDMAESQPQDDNAASNAAEANSVAQVLGNYSTGWSSDLTMCQCRCSSVEPGTSLTRRSVKDPDSRTLPPLKKNSSGTEV